MQAQEERYSCSEWIRLRLRLTWSILRGWTKVDGLLVCGRKSFRAEVEASCRLLAAQAPDVLELVKANAGFIIEAVEEGVLWHHPETVVMLSSHDVLSGTRTWTAGTIALLTFYAFLRRSPHRATRSAFAGDLVFEPDEVRATHFLRTVLQRLGAPEN